MRAVTRSITLDAPISATMALSEIATELVRAALIDHPRENVVTLLAISVSQIGKVPEVQLDLPLGLGDERRRPGARQGMARWSADRAVDAIRSRFGRDAIAYAVVVGGRGRTVPDAFRELAEKSLDEDDVRPGQALHGA